MKAEHMIFGGLGGMALLVAALIFSARWSGPGPDASAARPGIGQDTVATADRADPATHADDHEGVATDEDPATASDTAAAAPPTAPPPTPTASRPAAGAEPTADPGPPPPGADGPGPATPAEREPAQEDVAAILRATSERYEAVRSLQADFEQELENPLLGSRSRSSGTLYQRQPDRFLMRFSDPAGDLIVSDGRYFWLYLPSVDAKQVIRSGRGAQGLDLRAQFVGDPVRRFEATHHGRETVRGRVADMVTLVPREPLGYRRLKVWIDRQDRMVRRFELTEENGNVRRFELTDLVINPTLPDRLFEFTPPPGAVVVERG